MANSTTYHAKASEDKTATVDDLVALIQEYPIIGAVNVENLPALQLNRMRKQMRGTVAIRMAKRRLITLALQKSGKKGAEELIPYLQGMPALIFTKENPFKLCKLLKKGKSKAPIKAGQTAPNDIVVPAGPTGFAPGPIIGELGGLGIKAGIEGGKVAIKQDSTVAKAGTVVTQKMAAVLTRLGIEPMEIGLNLTGVLEHGAVIKAAVLDVDETVVLNDVRTAASWAFNLSVEAAFPTADTTIPIVQKAFRDAKALAVERDVLNDVTRDAILAKAEAQAQAVYDKTQ